MHKIQLLATAPRGERSVTFAFESFGRRIGLALSDATLLDEVLEILPWGWMAVEDGRVDRWFRVAWLSTADSCVHREGFHLYHGDEFRRWAPDRERAVEGIETEIEHDIAEFAHPWLFMHAGVVAWRGKAIVLPGASHAGKSTLTAALVEAGATYLSDEFAVLDANRQVASFPRRLSLRAGPLGPAGRLDLRHHAPHAAGMTSLMPIGLVAMIKYEENSLLRADMLAPGTAIMRLCQHMVAIQRRPQDALAALNAIAQAAPVLEGVRGDARHAAHWLLSDDAGR